MHITFSVNLANPTNWSEPVSLTDAVTNFPSTRVAYFPDDLRNNREMHHGDTFTVSGLTAYYLKKTYVSSPASANDLLIITSEVA